jgi:hypothetical protein
MASTAMVMRGGSGSGSSEKARAIDSSVSPTLGRLLLGGLLSDGKLDRIRLLGGFYVENFAPFIVAALGTGAMRHFTLMAVRAFGKRVPLERIVCTAPRGAGLRVASFGIWH